MNKKQNRKAGIKDIAELAGVSIGTIDRVLHNRSEVSEETRKKVMKIVEEVGYTPNIFAKSLSSKKTTKIAIALPDSRDNNPYWEKPIKGIKLAAEELVKYNVEIIYEHFDASNEASFRAVLQKITSNNPDGVVLNPVFEAIAKEFLKVFDERKTPYVFIDVDLNGADNLAYYGQDAERSGLVAARLMDLCTQNNSTILIVKQAKKKVFSTHIENRILGFNNYLQTCSCKNRIHTVTIEIDLNDPNEPETSLNQAFNRDVEVKGVFVPNSRGFKLASYLKDKKMKDLIVVGYDLIDPNVTFLQEGYITVLLSQKPEEQAYKAIYALFNRLVSRKEVIKTNFSAIDIITKENIDYYKQNK
jgi:LacI family transcriptional regulator